MIKRMCVLTVFIAFIVSIISMHIFSTVMSNDYKQTALNQGSYTLETGSVNGNIYDCNMKPIVNSENKYLCAINPSSDAVIEILPYIEDTEKFYSKVQYGKPFVYESDKKDFISENITVFEVPERYSKNQSAQHIIGYTHNGEGVCGIEKSYNTFLRSFSNQNSVTYKVDGLGDVLEGVNKKVNLAEPLKAGVVTSLDLEIQKICESAEIEKGCIVVMDIKSGDIKALVSYPSYSTENLEEALNNEDLPLLNRCLCSYNAGSVFKLLICQAALESGIADNFTYNCTGEITVNGQVFKCHEKDGHGYIDMKEAIPYSCNTYFIKLSQKITAEKLFETAEKMGFGKEIRLCDGLYTESGNLTSLEELKIPAEKANFSFGQGKLLVNPIQVTRMICAIANNGQIPSVQLIKGITYDGNSIENQSKSFFKEVMSIENAQLIQDFMTSYTSYNLKISAKTSTAQTGNYDENGNEYCHGWVSGYFPSDNPKYAVTVMVENGGYGNQSALPVLKEIAYKIINS